MNIKSTSNVSSSVQLSPEKLLLFFTDHLNRIYYAKAHLSERLTEIEEHADFLDLKHGIRETHEDVAKQMIRMEEIFTLMDIAISFVKCTDLDNLIEGAFSGIHQYSTEAGLRDLSILYYMQTIESIEMTSFGMLQLMAAQLKNKQIVQLLKENFDEAREDHILLALIAAKFIKG